MLKKQKWVFSLVEFVYLLFDFFFKNNIFIFFKNINLFFININDKILYFFKKYIYTINHKRIALNYFYFSFISGLSGTFLATLIRLELAYPGSHFFKGDSIRYLQVITSHGLIMIFFVVIPIIFGFFANFFIPYHIGSKDVAFPRLNSMGFWILFSGYILLAKPAFLRRQVYKYYDIPTYTYSILNNSKNFNQNFFFNYNNFFKTSGAFFFDKYNYFNLLKKNDINLSFPIKYIDIKSINLFYETVWSIFLNASITNKVKTTFIIQCPNASLTMAGWTFITPFSAKLKYTGFGAQDIAVISVIAAGISTTISFTNLLITRRTLSMPGLKHRKTLIPFLSINLFLTMRMLSLITPVLGAGMIMLQLDRHWGFSFFDYSYGGDPVLFHHLFWFFGHPEVYVIIIPAFGIISMLLPFSNSRRITSKNHLIWATYIMAYMGYLVWGHHMYLIGLDHRSRSLYSTITIMISLPAVVKLVNWTLTLLNGSFKWDMSILFAFSFLLFFLSGGLTGMWLSHVGLNVYVHDTFYVVAHFHFLFSASTFSAIFAGIYYYFGIIFNKKYSKIFAYFHLLYWFFGQWITFIPLYWVGYNGLPRRYHDYPLIFMGWHGISSAGHLLTLVSIIFFFLMLIDSFIINKTFIINNFYIPRWHKRINYYIFKIRYIQYFNKQSNISYLCFKLKTFSNVYYI